MRDYRVEVYFKGNDKPDTFYHYDCDNEDEAISEAIENLTIAQCFQIADVECSEFD